MFGLAHLVLLVCTTALVAFPAFADQGSSPTLPSSLFGLIILGVCVSSRKNEIGGWLLYYYIQLYIALLITLVSFALGFANYKPSSWGDQTFLYLMFMVSTVPGALIVPLELITAERVRRSRSFEQLGLLRGVLWIHLAVAVLGVGIDILFFRDSLFFSVLGLIWPAIWLPYFYLSKRVDRVFRTRDWLPDQMAEAVV